MVEDSAFSHKIYYVPIFKENLNPNRNLNLKGHLNRFIGSKSTAILVNRGISPSDWEGPVHAARAVGLFTS